ncbi:MAG TPA: aspartate--tRNA(Asn) ligase [Patescibacteria group bacterium]
MRILATETKNEIEKTVTCEGWINSRRDHGKLIFFDLRDRSGLLQIVSKDSNLDIRPEDVVRVRGKVVKRPDNLVNPNLETGSIELQAENVEILSKAAELPFDIGGKDLDLQLPTLLDFRALTLRHPKVKSIFKVQEAIMEGFRRAAQALEATEVFVPTISYSSTEGGAEIFKIDYYGHKAFMIQSPQLYKQMMIPIFERVYLISHAYRAEPSVTTRHLSESIQLDLELGFLEFEELLDSLERIGSETLKYASQKCSDILKEFNVDPPKVGGKIPRLKMREAQEIIYKTTGRDNRKEPDLTPEDEKDISAWALKEHGSDFVTITHYPTKKRAFYSHPDPKNPEFSLSYDLIFKGVEILSGSKRIHDYDKLVEVIVERGMNPKDFSMYLQAFKYGMPPHGGFSFGLERLTMKILDLVNVREASLFPRDMNRIDILLSSQPDAKKKTSK